MISIFASRLAARFDLTAADQEAIASLPYKHRTYSSGQSVSSEDRVCHHVGVMVSGFATCFKIVNEKFRQTTGFLLPGDTIDLPSILTGRPSSHVVADTDSEICWIGHDYLRHLCFSKPNIITALWLDSLIDAGKAREWIANIGKRNARDRIIYLLLEVAARQEGIGAFRDNKFELPINQSGLAQAVGLSLVHTNKSLRSLETGALLRKKGNIVEIFDRKALERQVGFNPDYLWLGPKPAQAVLRSLQSNATGANASSANS